MRTLVLVIASTLLTACGSAHGSQPDSSNPAHCIAALNYGNYWLAKGGKREMVTRGNARILFELEKLKRSGRSFEDAKVESARVTKSYANDPDRMDALLRNCLAGEIADAEFYKEWPGHLAAAQGRPATWDEPGR